MTKNKKNFYLGILSSIFLFGVSTIILVVPSYYGIEDMNNISVNNLFISMMLLYSTAKFLDFLLIGDDPTKESIFKSIAGGIAGIISVILSKNVNSTYTLIFSLTIFLLLKTIIGIFVISYYRSKNDSYKYVESIFYTIFFIVGVVIIFNMQQDNIAQTVLLGFYFIVLTIVELLDNSFKCMLRSKKFMNNISLK